MGRTPKLMRRLLVGLSAALGIAAAPPAAASARVLFASPTGSGTSCSNGSPCDLNTAVEIVGGPGDEVIVRPGTHDLGGDTVHIDDPMHVHGQAGAARPLIVGTGF